MCDMQASRLPAAVDRAWEAVGGGPADLFFPEVRRSLDQRFTSSRCSGSSVHLARWACVLGHTGVPGRLECGVRAELGEAPAGAGLCARRQGACATLPLLQGCWCGLLMCATLQVWGRVQHSVCWHVNCQSLN